MTGLYILIAALIVGRAAREVTYLLDRRSWAHEREALLQQVTAERRDFIALIDRVCQRLQAPDVAVAVQAQQELDATPIKQYASLDDDAEVAAAIDELQAMIDSREAAA